jgi:hypothetical protein
MNFRSFLSSVVTDLSVRSVTVCMSKCVRF